MKIRQNFSDNLFGYRCFLLKPKQTGKELGNGYKPHEQWSV